jgi:hypothetical protein
MKTQFQLGVALLVVTLSVLAGLSDTRASIAAPNSARCLISTGNPWKASHRDPWRSGVKVCRNATVPGRSVTPTPER